MKSAVYRWFLILDEELGNGTFYLSLPVGGRAYHIQDSSRVFIFHLGSLEECSNVVLLFR